MTSVLESLDIDFEPSSHETEGEEVADIENTEASNAGDELVKSLQESLIENKRLQSQIVELQEKLSVSYTKEISQERDITKLKLAVKKLSESVNKGNAMSHQLQTMKAQLEDKVRETGRQAKLIERYKMRLDEAMTVHENMESTLGKQNDQVNELRGKVRSLNENVSRTNASHQKELSKKDFEISSLREELEIKSSQYSKKLKSCNSLVERYKTASKDATNRYIGLKATTLGITPNEIKNRLNENFTLDDVDEVCESLRNYKRNVSRLPFSLHEGVKSASRVVVKEDESAHVSANPDDVIDQSLFNLLNT